MFASIVLFGVQCVQLPSLPCGELPNSEVFTNVWNMVPDIVRLIKCGTLRGTSVCQVCGKLICGN